jgi:steroid delta-isomerase-like uncharacterized protein
MSNKSVSTRFFETYGKQHDVEGCTPLFATDAMIHTTTAGPEPVNFDGYKQVGYAFLAGFDDLTVDVLDQLEAGDKVVSRVLWSGTHTGALNGIPPTGRRFRAEAIVIDQVADGQIKERWEMNDMLGMLQQLGVIPMPGA